MEPDRSRENLPARFFAEARGLLVEQSGTLNFEANDILRICENAGTRTEFIRLFNMPGNDPDLSRLILGYLEDIADDLEDQAKACENNVDLIDHTGTRTAAAATAAGIAAIFATGGSVGAVILFAAGIVGLTATGLSRFRLRRTSLKYLSSAQKTRRLARNLGEATR